MCDCDKSLGELRERIDALWRKVEEVERKVERLDREEQRMTGWTVTPAPVWDA